MIYNRFHIYLWSMIANDYEIWLIMIYAIWIADKFYVLCNDGWWYWTATFAVNIIFIVIISDHVTQYLVLAVAHMIPTYHSVFQWEPPYTIWPYIKL